MVSPGVNTLGQVAETSFLLGVRHADAWIELKIDAGHVWHVMPTGKLVALHSSSDRNCIRVLHLLLSVVYPLKNKCVV